MRISDWSSDVCSSDLPKGVTGVKLRNTKTGAVDAAVLSTDGVFIAIGHTPNRSEEHTSELQSLMRSSYAAFCLNTKRCPHATPLSCHFPPPNNRRGIVLHPPPPPHSPPPFSSY